MNRPTQRIRVLPQPAPPEPTRFGALAWTAVILGIIGVVGAPIASINSFSVIAAFAGLALGVIALFGTRRVLAIISVVLCVVGIAITVVTQEVAEEKHDASPGEQPAVTGESPLPTGKIATWGKRYTWENGLAVDVAVPEACKPSQYAVPPNIVRAMKFKITITNGMAAAFETALLTLGNEAQFNGRKAEKVFDSSGGGCDSAFDDATVLPGKTYTYEVAYSVGAQPGEMQLVFEPAFGADKAVFVGQV